jgi:hypothetical protein
MAWQPPPIDQLPRICARLQAIDVEPPHFEASAYGPLDKYLNSQLSDNFMLKPQGPLRHPVPEIAPPGEPRTSNDSYNNQVYSRRGKNPDFILCHFTETPNDDAMIALIEVKLKGDIIKAIEQLAIYLDILDASVPGIAIAGNDVAVIWRDPVTGCQVEHEFDLLTQEFLHYFSGLMIS